jgi:hypothetical protein
MNRGLASDDGLEITIDGSTLTIDEDFWLYPSGRGPSEPATQIKFAFELSADPDTILIESDMWGYCETLPTNVERALLAKGAATYLRDGSGTGTVGTGGSLKRLKQDDVEKEFGSTSSSATGEYSGTLQEQLEKQYQRSVSRYRAPWKVLA